MAKYLLVSLIAAVVLAQLCDSKPYQMLKTREGYVPVYIRFGDQPLADINPDLAEAFGEVHEISPRNIKNEAADTHAKFEIPFLKELGDSATSIGTAAGKTFGAVPELVPGISSGSRNTGSKSESSNNN